MVGLTLTFRQVDCARCGSARQAVQPCPECGEAPARTDIDFNLQLRQRVAARTAESRERDVDVPTWTATDVLREGQLAGLVGRLFRAAQAAVSDPRKDSGELRVVAEDIGRLERWAATPAALRPFRAIDRETRAAVIALGRVLDLVLAALEASSIEEAQRLPRELQAALDQAGDAAEAVSLHSQRLEESFSAPDPLAYWIGAQLEAGYEDATARGQEMCQQRLGRPVPRGVGLPVLALDAMVATFCDQEQFWQAVRDHLPLLEANKNGLATILSSQEFLDRYGDVVHDGWAVARRAASASDPESMRQAATDVLEGGHLATEQALKFHLGVASALTTRMTFEETQARDVSELAQIARDKRWAVAAALPESDIRNAFAHRDYKVDSDGAVLLAPLGAPRRKSVPRQVSLPALQDAVLELIEVSAAMDLCLLLVAEELGLSNQVVFPQVQFAMATMLECLGWKQSKVDVTSTTVSVSAIVDGEQQMGNVAFAAHAFADTHESLVLHLERSDTGRRVQVDLPLARYAKWSGGACPVEKEASWISLGASTLKDGEPVISLSHAEMLIAFRVCQVASDKGCEFTEVRRLLGIWRQLAKDLGLEKTQRLVGRALNWRLRAAAGMQVDAADMQELLAVLKSEVPPLSTVLI